jgi:hypothetical protein
LIFQDQMVVGVNMLVFNPSGDLVEGAAKMEAQAVRIDPQNSGSSQAYVPNTEVSA